jgi:hypothetical protein
LTADAPASIEDDRLEAFALEVSRGDEPRRPRPDDRHLRHGEILDLFEDIHLLGKPLQEEGRKGEQEELLL